MKFIARCDKFQSYERRCRVMIALRQVMIFRKRKSDKFRLRRNVKGADCRWQSLPQAEAPTEPAGETLRLAF